MDRLHHARVGIAGPVTLQQFDLYMVERIEVGKAVLINRRRQQGILVEQCSLAGDLVFVDGFILREPIKKQHEGVDLIVIAATWEGQEFAFEVRQP
jgi:hypothetical protein